MGIGAIVNRLFNGGHYQIDANFQKMRGLDLGGSAKNGNGKTNWGRGLLTSGSSIDGNGKKKTTHAANCLISINPIEDIAAGLFDEIKHGVYKILAVGAGLSILTLSNYAPWSHRLWIDHAVADFAIEQLEVVEPAPSVLKPLADAVTIYGRADEDGNRPVLYKIGYFRPYESILPQEALEIALQFEDKRYVVPKDASISERFWEHDGFSLLDFLRASFGYVNGTDGSGGASTIASQIKKMEKLTPRDLQHKAEEWIYAIDLTRKNGKTSIVDNYLKSVPIGRGRVYGIPAAVYLNFGKEIGKDKISDLEYAVLCSTIPNANILECFRKIALEGWTFEDVKKTPHWDIFDKKRRKINEILKERSEDGKITQDEFERWQLKDEEDIRNIGFRNYSREELNELHPGMYYPVKAIIEAIKYESHPVIVGGEKISLGMGTVFLNRDEIIYDGKKRKLSADTNIFIDGVQIGRTESKIYKEVSELVIGGKQSRAEKQFSWEFGEETIMITGEQLLNNNDEGSIKGHIEVYTEFDPRMQAYLSDALENFLNDKCYFDVISYKNGGPEKAKYLLENEILPGGVIMDAQNRIVAIQGERSSFKNSPDIMSQYILNKFIMGSMIKPIILAAALSEGFKLDTLVRDTPVYMGKPKNPYGPPFGWLALGRAVYLSSNGAAANIMQATGIKDGRMIKEAGKERIVLSAVIDFLRNLGDIFDPIIILNHSFALGTVGQNSLNLCANIGAAAHTGILTSPTIYQLIESGGKIIYLDKDNPHYVNLRVYNPKLTMAVAYVMNQVARNGTGSRMNLLHRSLAYAKTGTVDDETWNGTTGIISNYSDLSQHEKDTYRFLFGVTTRGSTLGKKVGASTQGGASMLHHFFGPFYRDERDRLREKLRDEFHENYQRQTGELIPLQFDTVVFGEGGYVDRLFEGMVINGIQTMDYTAGLDDIERIVRSLTSMNTDTYKGGRENDRLMTRTVYDYCVDKRKSEEERLKDNPYIGNFRFPR